MKEIPLTQGQVALVDDEDFDRANQFKWCAHRECKTFYAVRNLRLPDGTPAQERLHQFILGVKGVDHRDGDGLNNQKHNLRKATQRQNVCSHRRKSDGATSQYRGVYWVPRLKKWQAQTKVNGRSVYLGVHLSEESAARAYDEAAKKFFGEFASPNFP